MVLDRMIPPSAMTESMFGKVVEVDLHARWIALGNSAQALPEPFSPIEHRRGVELERLLVEQAILIARGGDEASGMPVRQIAHQFGHHFKADEKAVQRVLVELIGAGEQLIEQRIVALHVAD